MKRIFLVIMLPFLVGCGIKDPSFYDLKSPCASLSLNQSDPCHRVSPELNELYSS